MAFLCGDEGSFGPVASCRHMDFTLGFQFRFMSITPSALFLFCCILRVKTLIESKRVTKHAVDILSAFKLVSGLVLLAGTSACVALAPRVGWGKWATVGYSLDLLATACFMTVSYFHHTTKTHPSSMGGLYMALTLLFSATQLRTYITTEILHTSLFPAFVVTFAARFLLVVTEFANKRKFLSELHKPVALEETASLPERLIFVYLYPLLRRGFQGPITLDQLNEFGLPPVMSSGPANSKLSQKLALSRDSSGKQAIFMPSMRAFFSVFTAPVIPKLFLIATTFTQPFLVESMLLFVSSYSDEDGSRQDPAYGWGLVGAYALVYLLIAFCTALYWDKVYAMVVCYRAALVSVIFDKSMRLSASVSESKGGTAVTYMSVDVERVCEGIAFFHETWSALLSIAVAAVVLWFKATFAMIPPIVIMIAFFFITSYIGKRVANSQKRWMESTQARVKILTSITSQMIPLKFLGVESTVPGWVNPVRNREIAHLKAFYLKLVVVGVLSSATINFAGLAALGTFVGISAENLRSETLFTILTVVNLVTLPISTVGNCFPLLLASHASMKRIAEFLSLGEKLETPSESLYAEKSDSDLSEKASIHKSNAFDSALSLLNASVAVSEGGKPLLTGISVSFARNMLTMIVGPVASGKTVLLRTLLGENFVVSGSSNLTQGKVAYAPQEAFIWPTTVRENIILDGIYEPGWYNTVVKACALEDDFSQMEKGDMTVMTSGSGSSVSGGQKQRISLARAVYARCEVTLLDDCFSALDAHTSASVFSNLFSQGGLLRGKQVILVTHNLLHLSTADRVLILDACAIVAEGSLYDLRAGQLDIARYVGEQKNAEAEDEVEEKIVSKPNTATPNKISPVKLAPSEAKKLEEVKANKWGPYLFYLRACGWKRLSICFACLITYTSMQIGLQLLLKYWAESGATDHGPWLGGYAAFTVICFTTSFITLYVYAQLTAPHASLVIHARQLAAVLAAPVTYFQRTPVAQLQNRWSGDMYISDFAFPRATQDFMFTAVYVVGAIVLILIAVPWLAISVPFLVVAYWGLQRIYLATSRQLQALTMSSKTPIYTAFTTTLNGLVAIRAFRAEKMFKDQSMYHLDRAQVPMYYRYAGIRFLRTSLNLVTALIAISVAALAVGLRNSTSGGYLGIALSQLVGLSQSLINLLLAYTRVENGMVSVGRIFELDSLEPEDGNDSRGAVGDVEKHSAEWPSRGAIEFRDVSLRYREDMEPVLHSLCFSVSGGEKLGICGRTGSGKSSTVFALLRGLGRSDLFSGQIFIDGVDISTIPINELRSAISTVSQDPFLLYASMRDNLVLGCTPKTDDEIWDALRLVGMHGAVDKLESKLETVIAADGSQFSAGERQLLCIARVLLQKRKIVVLDEASSSMDSATDKQLLHVLSTSLRNVTVISVAHRISTIVDFDKVMVLDSGRVVEIGAPKELIASPNSLFAGLYEKQTA